MKIPKSLADKKALYIKASDAYYNSGKAIMTDAEFNALEADIKAADPKWAQLKKTGVRAPKKIEVPLTYYMPSLNKKYPDAYPKWRAKQPKTLLRMPKLDGSSLQLTYSDGAATKLVTRGDGVNGGDISFLIPYLSLPKIKNKETMVFRVEAVLRKKIFDKKYAADFENARAAVNGWLNRRKPHPGLTDVDLVVLGLYGVEMHAGLLFAAKLGLQVVDNDLVSGHELSAALAEVRKECPYEADGLVLCDPNHVLEYHNADKPKWIVAYKENDEEGAAEATAVRVLWQDSRNSRLIPKIEIKPIRLGGVTVTYCTVHNAEWMTERKIGPGAVVKILRSGDVIPKIVGVVKPGKLQLPTVKYKKVGVHFVSLERSKESVVREIHFFFATLGIEFIAQKTIDKLYDAGFTSVTNYLAAYADKTPYARVTKVTGLREGVQATQGVKAFIDAGIGEAVTLKIFAEFDRVFRDGVLLRDLMVASNCFPAGFGDRKIKVLEKFYADRTNLLKAMQRNKVKFGKRKLKEIEAIADEGNALAHIVKGDINVGGDTIKSFGAANAKAFAEGLGAFRPWLKRVLKYIKVRKPTREQPKTGKLTGQKFSFTGYRDTEHEQWIMDRGGEVVSFGKQTQVLFYKEGGKASSKIAKAEASGIKTMTFDLFKKGVK